MKLLIFFLLGLACGLLLSGCATRYQPVLLVPQPCVPTQDLPYVLDATVPDDQLVCVSVWRENPLDTVICMKVGELKLLIAGLKKT